MNIEFEFVLYKENILLKMSTLIALWIVLHWVVINVNFNSFNFNISTNECFILVECEYIYMECHWSNISDHRYEVFGCKYSIDKLLSIE